MHGVRLAGGAGWVVNAHASLEPPERRKADLALAVATAREWAGEEPLVFGGDLNATRPAFAGLRHVARHHVDHLFVTGRHGRGRRGAARRGRALRSPAARRHVAVSAASPSASATARTAGLASVPRRAAT